MPRVALEVVELCDRGEARPEEIARWLGRDPDLAARFVRMANSAALAVTRRVGTLSQAVHVIGLRAVRSITLASSVVRRTGETPLPGFDRAAFWQDAVISALVSRALLFHAGSPHAEEAFLAGLVRDIGVPALARTFGKSYADLLAKVEREDVDPGEIEAAHLGGTHAEVSAMLLDEWGFPVAIVVAVQHHLEPPRAPLSGEAAALSAALFATEEVGRMLRAPTDRRIAQLSRRARETFGVGPATLREILAYIEANLVEICEALRLETTNLEELRANRRRIEERLDAPAGARP